MRVEPYAVGSVLHIVKRGARGMDIVKDDGDRWRFVRSLYILNDHFLPPSRTRVYTSDVYTRKNNNFSVAGIFHRAEEWPPRKPLVAILAWTLLNNHFHLLIQEIYESGTSRFMQRLGNSMSRCFNEKYEETGSLFQGSFRSRTVENDTYLNYVHLYIVVKNTFENFPGGLQVACADFDQAWDWATKSYSFSSFLSSTHGVESPIIDLERFSSLGLEPNEHTKVKAKEMLKAHLSCNDRYTDLQLEDWE